MRSHSVLTVIAAVSSCLAAPTAEEGEPVAAVAEAPVDHARVLPRAATQPYNNQDILNFALTLEYIGRAFYEQGLTNYTMDDFCNCGFDPQVYYNLQQVYSDEQAHVAFLQTALGDDAVPEGEYQFPSYDPTTFVQFAAILEGVAISGFSGAAAAVLPDYIRAKAEKRAAEAEAAGELVEKKDLRGNGITDLVNEYVLAADAILGVESQHAGYVRYITGYPAFPNSFSTPLGLNATYSIAADSIKSMPPYNGNNSMPFTAYPELTLASQEDVYIPGVSNVTFLNAYANALDAGLIKPGTPVYAVFYSGLGTYYSPTTVAPNNRDLSAQIPTSTGGMNNMFAIAPPSGQTYVLLSTADGQNDTATDSNVVAGVGILEVAPAPQLGPGIEAQHDKFPKAKAQEGGKTTEKTGRFKSGKGKQQA